ncbi:hypothetical protein I4F81_009964 [Pyropia yezoensis]|uniref:Uncharacterized protein n=1 Tax=Pyropia yezoensis TaxID=2788 RepID=A0ACC3CBK4_PYRYE|nr:hypothetical protein I4F81_009964 [Neopyropia yezoensis]
MLRKLTGTRDDGDRPPAPRGNCLTQELQTRSGGRSTAHGGATPQPPRAGVTSLIGVVELHPLPSPTHPPLNPAFPTTTPMSVALFISPAGPAPLPRLPHHWRQALPLRPLHLPPYRPCPVWGAPLPHSPPLLPRPPLCHGAAPTGGVPAPFGAPNPHRAPPAAARRGSTPAARQGRVVGVAAVAATRPPHPHPRRAGRHRQRRPATTRGCEGWRCRQRAPEEPGGLRRGGRQRLRDAPRQSQSLVPPTHYPRWKRPWQWKAGEEGGMQAKGGEQYDRVCRVRKIPRPPLQTPQDTKQRGARRVPEVARG